MALKLVKDGHNRYRLRRAGRMNVDCLVYLSEQLLPLVRGDESLVQLARAAELPGVVGHVCGMPDIHQGFGLPIGGIMASGENGVISAGAVGMDINCGVRLLRSSLKAGEMDEGIFRKLIDRIEYYVPTGVGKKSKHSGIDRKVFENAVHSGASTVIEMGYGYPEDLNYTEEGGRFPGADLGAVSSEAIKRGAVQLGTLGGGNHFIEIQEVERIYEEKTAQKFGLFCGQLVVMIHTGSRGFGHQICVDYSKSFLKVVKKFNIELPSKGLACAPINSPEGKSYYAAMACAINFAFSNRQLIAHDVRRAFRDVLGMSPGELEMQVVYDVAHNIAKWERHLGREVLVHRKGATRALPPGHPDNPPQYRMTGHPALIPGSMGTASYVLTGTEKAKESFYSVNHGAGRVLSRKAASREISREQFEKSMRGIIFNRRNYRELLDEAPEAYKNIEEVINTLADIGMTCKVARMRPLAVIKGKD